MALNFDWSLFQQSRDRKNQNQRQALADAQGIGQNFNSLIQNLVIEKKKKEQQEQQGKSLNTFLSNPTVPQQQRNNLSAVIPFLNQQNAGSLLPDILKNQQPKVTTAWHPVPGMLSKGGKPIEINEQTGEYREAPIAAKPAGGLGSGMATVRQNQYTLQDLPSNQPANTAGGAAYQVLVGSQQGMNLIARPGSVQRTGLAQGDLARTILRNSPTDEALRNANFSDNLITRWGQMKQRLTADPQALANPQIRKEMYDIFSEMRTSAKPFIQNQLDDMNDAGFPVTPNTRKRQLGETLPVIPFDAGTSVEKSATPSSGWSYVGPVK